MKHKLDFLPRNIYIIVIKLTSFCMQDRKINYKLNEANLRVGHVHAAHDHDEREDELEDGEHGERVLQRPHVQRVEVRAVHHAEPQPN